MALYSKSVSSAHGCLGNNEIVAYIPGILEQNLDPLQMPNQFTPSGYPYVMTGSYLVAAENVIMPHMALGQSQPVVTYDLAAPLISGLSSLHVSCDGASDFVGERFLQAGASSDSSDQHSSSTLALPDSLISLQPTSPRYPQLQVPVPLERAPHNMGRNSHTQRRPGYPPPSEPVDHRNSLNSHNGAQNRKRLPKGYEGHVKRTVYINGIDNQITEEKLAAAFVDCGKVVHCKICVSPSSTSRFAFIEFTNEKEARKALSMSGRVLGDLRLDVYPSKSPILPMNKALMPSSQEDMDRCSRAVYVTNIDKRLSEEEIIVFFQKRCGNIERIRVLADSVHPTRAAFVEFGTLAGKEAALKCTGCVRGTLSLRVCPSKTPVRVH